MVFDRDGTFLHSWGEGLFARPHGITIGPDDAVYCTDDLGHTVRKFTPDGTLLLTLGTSGTPSDTGATSMDYRTILRAGPPFHYPTNVALSPEGELYVSDGYGNARVHKFSADGRLLFSWGEPGNGDGQFHLPHGIAVDRRESCTSPIARTAACNCSRPTALSSPNGRTSPGLARSSSMRRGTSMSPNWAFAPGCGPARPPRPRRAGRSGQHLRPARQAAARWGGGRNPCAPGDFFAPHDICVDSHGDIYVAEVVMSAGGNRGLVSPTVTRCRSSFARKLSNDRMANGGRQPLGRIEP